MFYIKNPPLPTKTCAVCQPKYQWIINGIATEKTPLIYHHPVTRKRWTDKYAVPFIGALTLILFLGITIGFRLLMVETEEAVPSHVVSLATRQNWGATKVKMKKDVAAEANKLILVFTNSPRCYDQETCTWYIRKLQDDSFQRNETDILYNFIIAGDNRVYEGRGWQYAPSIYPYSDNTTLAIAFLGYPGETNLSPEQKDQLLTLVNLSISHHKLKTCFRILARPKEKPHLQDLIDRVHDTIIKDGCG